MNKNKYGQPFMSVFNFPIYMITKNHLHVKNANDFEPFILVTKDKRYDSSMYKKYYNEEYCLGKKYS